MASYLGNHAGDSLLAALPLSFDAGFSQLTTAFYSGARVVLHNYLLPQDLLKTLAREKITGLTAVPPLYMQLVQQRWPEVVDEHLRYFANTGGRMPLSHAAAVAHTITAQPALSDVRPDRSLPLHLSTAGRGRRSSRLHWQGDPECRGVGAASRTAANVQSTNRASWCIAARWSQWATGTMQQRPRSASSRCRAKPDKHWTRSPYSPADTVRRDAEGFLYFIGRRDDMIKTSGYRVSPSEIEEAVHASGLVAECCAYGVEDETLGQRIHLVIVPAGTEALSPETLLQACRNRLPAYMLPSHIEIRTSELPRECQTAR